MYMLGDRLRTKVTNQMKAHKGTQSLMHEMPLIAGCTFLVFILGDVYQEFSSDKIAFSFAAVMGNHWLWFMLLASIGYISRHVGKRKTSVVQANRAESQEASNGKEVDFGKRTQHVKTLVSNTEHGDGGGPSQRMMRRVGPAVCHKQLRLSQVHNEGFHNIAHKKESLRLAIKAGDAQKVERLLQELFDAGFLPDVRTCNFVINACAKKGDVACAETWFMNMLDKGVTPNKTSYNMIICACVKASDVLAAKRWFGRMIKDGQTPDKVSYTNMIHAYAKHGATEQAEAWLQQMLKAGVEADIVTYNSLIVSCSRNGDIAGAERWAYQAEKIDIAAGITKHTVGVATCATCDGSPAEKQMEKMGFSKAQPIGATYSSIIDACAKVGDRDGALRWHRRMLQRGLQPKGNTLRSIVTACAKAGDALTASQHLMSMEKAQLSVVLYGSVFNACAKAGDSETANKLFQHMQSSGIQPNASVPMPLSARLAAAATARRSVVHGHTCQGESGECSWSSAVPATYNSRGGMVKTSATKLMRVSPS